MFPHPPWKKKNLGGKGEDRQTVQVCVAPVQSLPLRHLPWPSPFKASVVHPQLCAEGLLSAKRIVAAGETQFRETDAILSGLQSFKHGDRCISRSPSQTCLSPRADLRAERYGIWTLSRRIFKKYLFRVPWRTSRDLPRRNEHSG